MELRDVGVAGSNPVTPTNKSESYLRNRGRPDRIWQSGTYRGLGPTAQSSGPQSTNLKCDLGQRNQSTSQALRPSAAEHWIPVASAEEALAAVDGGARLDLLMTDYHLGPNQMGIQVISALRERLGPQLKAILVTGDTSSAIRGLSPDPQLRILSKPIRAEALLRLMREFLTGEESAWHG